MLSLRTTKGRLAAVACAALLLCLCGVVGAQTRTRRPARTRTSSAAPPRTNNASQTSTTAPADSQRPTNQATPSAAQVSEEEADVAITANVRARELTFEVVPNPSVEFPGRPARRTVWEAERENLPRPVRPGETYRDIGVRLRILSVFADIERIVAEALGEVPPTEGAPPSTTQPAQTPPQSSPPQPTPPPARPESSTPASPAPPKPTDTGRRP